VIAWLKAGALGVAAGAAVGAWGGWWVRDAAADRAELARVQAEQRDALRRQEAALGAAQTYEEARDAIRRDLMRSMPRVGPALAAPACPASAPLAVGDVVLPAGALDRVRAAAGADGDADPPEPGPAVPRRPADPGR
jgi:hypothetical protein